MTVLLAATVTAAAALAGSPSYAAPGPVDDVVRTVQQGVHDALGEDVGDPGTGRGVSSPVVGYIFIQHLATAGQTRPTYTLSGALADATLWSCSDNFPALPYTVTCLPLPSTLLSWQCDVLHADVTGLTLTSRARTTLDCDGSAPAEAQTGIVVGPGHDFLWSPSPVVVSQFSCTVDGGSQPATPDYYAGCGDPGVPTIR